MSDVKLIRIWDRDYNLCGQLFAEWDNGTFTVPTNSPEGIMLWRDATEKRCAPRQITVERTDEFAWWVESMARKDNNDTFTVHCRPHLDFLRDCVVPDVKLVELWLAAEKKWKDEQRSKPGVAALHDDWAKRSPNWTVEIGDGQPIPMSEFTLGDRFPPRQSPDPDRAARDKLNAKVMQTINSRFDFLYDRDGKMLPHNWFEHPDRATKWATGQRVARTVIGDIVVSTVWLMGIDHEWRPGHPPLIFETMIFGRGGDDDCRRYNTEEQAIRGHITAVDRIRAGLAPFRDGDE
jgi:hypothetical protein